MQEVHSGRVRGSRPARPTQLRWALVTASSTAFVPATADAPPAIAQLEPVGPGARQTPSAARRLRATSALAFGFLLVASVLVRLQGTGMWFWIDEALTVGIAQQRLEEIPSVLRADGSPPLYYLLLHMWMQLFGNGEASTHALSLLLATASVPVGYWAGCRLFDRRTGVVVAVLTATSPFLTHFARETRMYTLVTLLALVVAANFVLAFVRGSRGATIGFGAALTFALYTHNWAIYLAVACVVALVPVALASPYPLELLRRGAVTFAAVGLAYLPWAFVLLSQIGDTGAPWSYTPRAREVVGEVAALVRDERALVLLAAVVGAGILELLRRPRTAQGATAWALCLMSFVPVGLGWTVAQVEPSWATRYLAVIVGPLLLLVGWGLARAGTTGVIALIIAVTLWVQPLTRLDGGIRFEPDAKSDGKALAASLDRRLEDGDLVIVAQPEAVPLFAHYMEDDVRFATLWGEVDRPMIMDWRNASERLEATNVDEHLFPLIESLEPGAKIALVGPGGRIVPTDTEWIRTFHRRHGTWRRALQAGPTTVLAERIASARRDRLVVDSAPGPGAERGGPVAVPFSATVFDVVEARVGPARSAR